MKWLCENPAALVFLATTLLSVLVAILKTLGKANAAAALEKVQKILEQTFSNVEDIKRAWKESGCQAKFGHIGTIFGKLNEIADPALAADIQQTYEEWKFRAGYLSSFPNIVRDGVLKEIK